MRVEAHVESHVDCALIEGVLSGGARAGGRYLFPPGRIGAPDVGKRRARSASGPGPCPPASAVCRWGRRSSGRRVVWLLRGCLPLIERVLRVRLLGGELLWTRISSAGILRLVAHSDALMRTP